MGEIGGARGRGKSPLKNGGAVAKCVLGGISSGIKKEVETFLVHVSLSFSNRNTRCPYPDRHVLLCFLLTQKNHFLLCNSNNGNLP